MAVSVETRVLNFVQVKNEPLTLHEIQEAIAASSIEEIKATLQDLEVEEKIRSFFIPEAQSSVYTTTSCQEDVLGPRFQKRNFSTPHSTVARSSSKLRQPFKSPLQSRQNHVTTENRDSLLSEIKELESKLDNLNQDIKDLSQDYSEEELQLHINKLHEYNEIKDVGQLLMGKLAEIDGTTTKAMYKEFALDLDD